MCAFNSKVGKNMRSKTLTVLLYLSLFLISNPSLWNVGISSFSVVAAHLQESKQDNEEQRNQDKFLRPEYNSIDQIKVGHGVGRHGGSRGSHGVIPQNAGGSAQNHRNNQHHSGGSSYKLYAGYLTIIAIFLAILNKIPSDL